MRSNIQTISLQSIELYDRTYRVSIDRPFDDLFDSLRRVGLLCLPILKRKSDKHIIVDGFRRIAACMNLGWPDVEARIIEPGASHLECLMVAIAANATTRSLNLIEQSMAVARLSDYFPDETTLSRIAGDLGVSLAPALIPKLKRLCLLPEIIQKGVLSGTISLTIALALGNLNEPSAVALAQLFELLKPTLNHQKEILSLIKEISKINEVSMVALLNENFIAEIMQHPDLNRNQKIRNLLDALRKRRYPVIAAFEDKFKRQIKSLELPGTIKIIPPKDFEEGMYAVIFNFQTLSEITTHIDTLGRLVRRPEFAAILTKEIEDH